MLDDTVVLRSHHRRFLLRCFHFEGTGVDFLYDIVMLTLSLYFLFAFYFE